MVKRTRTLLICIMIFTMSMLSIASAHALGDTIKVVCVGNSITEGWMTNNPVTDNYAVQCGTLLGPGWLVKNAGVSGRTMLRSGDFPIWNEQKFKAGLAFNPNIVTICLGTNDSKPYNWDDKESFVKDYIAMIDTFRSLPSNPVVWLCLPPPVFIDAFDIRDSIMVADIMPMINQIALTKNCPIIDFYTLLLSHPDMVPDGIHPNTIGSAVMAEFLYSTLTGNALTRVKEENAAAGKDVVTSGSIDSMMYGGTNLVDGTTTTEWITLGFPSEAVFDLGSDQIVDLFRIDFGSAINANTGYQFRIETAGSAGGYTTVLDRTTRTDSALIIHEKTDSLSARFIRITITGAARPRGDSIGIAEFRILKANGGSHAPALTARRNGGTTTNPRYEVKFVWPNGADGKMILYRFTNTGGLRAVTPFINGNTYTMGNEIIKTGNYNMYYAATFLNGVETVSDSLFVGTLPTSVSDEQLSVMPLGIRLLPCYPNPFNPSTNISFELPSTTFVSLKVFDLIGREVATLVSEELSSGTHTRQWNAGNMTSGVYFYRLQASDFMETKKLLLLK